MSSSSSSNNPSLSPAASDAPSILDPSDPEKVIIRFRAAGNAPILKKNVYRLTSTHPFSTVLAFLRSQLAYKGPESLFVYVNSAFSPAPDEPIINLYRCFATGGQLILHYSTTAAWG